MSNETQPTIPFETVDGLRRSGPAADPTTPDGTVAGSTPAGPVIRWAAVIWGLVIAGIAGITLAIVTDASRRDDVTAWLGTLTAGTFALYVLLVIGALLLVAGLAGILRRATRPRG
ncbi:MAG: hypothetical protein ABWX82_00930 [Leifsonia sp.]